MENGATISVEAIAQALLNIYRENVDIDHDIEEHLFRETKRIFDEAITEGYANASERQVSLPDEAFRDAFLHSADVISAFRVHKMQRDIAAQMIDENGQLKPFSKFVKDVSPYIEHKNRAWLQTEYNTAIIRAQNAAEWKQFQEEKDIYPNLEWIRSTSPNPGADHRVFWGTVLPVDDPFWDEHKPGDRWNCKCELRQTDKQSTPAPVSDGKSDPAPGLESNPAKAEEVFSDSHPYYPDSCLTCPFAGNRLMALAHDLAQGKHCNRCGRVSKVIGKHIDAAPDKGKAGAAAIAEFVQKHLDPVNIGNGQVANQKTITCKNGDALIFRRTFFKETLSKCVRKNNTGETMQIAFEFEKWAKKLKYVGTELGRHHDCEFRVYEVIYTGKRIELKAKDTEGFIAYMIRVYDK